MKSQRDASKSGHFVYYFGVDHLDEAADPSAEGLELALTFFAICRERSLRAAGAHLGLTASAVRKRLNRLAEVYGGDLVEPHGDFRLTPIGESVWERCRGPESALRAAWRLSCEVEGRRALRIATTGIGIRFHLPPVLHEWRRTFPTIPLSIERVEGGVVAALVRDGRVRFGIGRAPHDAPELRSTPYAGSRPVVAYPSGFGAVGAVAVTEDLLDRELGWVMPAGSRRGWARLHGILGREPKLRAEVGNYDDAALYASQGFGATLCSELFAEEYRQRGTLLVFPPRVLLAGDEPRYPGALMWLGRAETLDVPFEREFVRCFKEVMRSRPPIA